jgi:hypothetical protein
MVGAMSDVKYILDLPPSKQPQEIKDALLALYRDVRSYTRDDIKRKADNGEDFSDDLRRLRMVRRFIRRLSRKPKRAQR